MSDKKTFEKEFNIKINSCPFCGYGQIERKTGEYDKSCGFETSLTCMNCQASGPINHTRYGIPNKQTLLNWNKRLSKE